MKFTKNKAIAFLIAFTLLLGLAGSVAATSDFSPNKEVIRTTSGCAASNTVFTATGTTYTPSSCRTDFDYYTEVGYWFAPTFVSTGTVTATVQVSYDGVNWLTYKPTTNYTVTSKVFTTSTVDYLIVGVPAATPKMRLQIEKTGVATVTLNFYSRAVNK